MAYHSWYRNEAEVNNEQLVAVLLQLAVDAFAAYQAAATTPITADAFMALLPNATPLTPPETS